MGAALNRRIIGKMAGQLQDSSTILQLIAQRRSRVAEKHPTHLENHLKNHY